MVLTVYNQSTKFSCKVFRLYLDAGVRHIRELLPVYSLHELKRVRKQNLQ